jgi:hypothetical protein
MRANDVPPWIEARSAEKAAAAAQGPVEARASALG